MSSNKTIQVPKVIPNDWVRLRIIIDKLKHLRLGGGSSPEFAGLTLTGLTAERLVWTDSAKALASKDLLGLVAGTANEINVADDGSGGVTIGIVDPLIVGKGGIGTDTLTDHGILLGSGTGAVTPLGVAANGQLPIGSAGADPVLAALTGTTDHISVANGAGSITLDLDTNTQTLLGSFNGIFLEKLNFTISEAGGTVTGTLEQDGGGDLIQKFSDGYTTLDCTPAKTIDLTAYVGTDAVPKEVFIYILQSAKTTIVASNVDWPLDPEVEHIKIAHLVLKSATTTGTDGGALMNQNHNDYAFDATGEGHLQDIEHRLRQEPAQYHSGIALTLKNSAGAALTTGNSSTAVELVSATGHIFQIHQHNFPAFDMYSVATDKADIVNQPTDEGGGYETTTDLVTDVTHYVDGTAAGVAIGTNKYFNLVIWGVMNRTGETSFLMINLPTGQYTKESDAISDIDGVSVFEIPSAFKGVGFLIARLTFRLIGGAQWTYIAQEDLRGKIPDIIAGVGITTTDHALLANLDFASAGHTGFQAQGDVLDDLNTTGAVGADSEFLVGTGAGALAWEAQQTAMNSISDVSGATNEHVLTKDTGTGNAIFKAAAGGTDVKCGVDVGATADYVGAANSDGFLRTGTSLSYTDGGNFVTLNTVQGIRTVDSPTFAGITIADGGTVGQAAGPLLRFDDTNNYLEITGCKVGIGITTPLVDLHVVNNSTNPQLIIDSDFLGNIELRTHNNASNFAAFLSYRRSRGTAASPTANSAGDIIAIFNAIGYTSQYDTAARIEFGCDTGWGSAGDSPGYMYLKTTPNATNNPVTRLAISNSGAIHCLATYSVVVGGTNRDLYIDNTGLIGYVSSGRKYKSNIQAIEDWETDSIYNLRPVKYDRIDGTAFGEMGLIAEEVDDVMPGVVSYKRELVGYEPTDNIGGAKEIFRNTNIPETVNYSRLIVPMLKEIQKLRTELNVLNRLER